MVGRDKDVEEDAVPDIDVKEDEETYVPTFKVKDDIQLEQICKKPAKECKAQEKQCLGTCE